MSPESLGLEYWSLFENHVELPTRSGQGEQLDELLLLEGLVADDADLTDLGGFAFDRVEVRSTVPLERRDRSGDLHAVQALGEVLALEFLLGTFEQRAVEDAGFGEADFLQALLEGILFRIPWCRRSRSGRSRAVRPPER